MQNKNKQSAKISRNLKFIVLSLVFLLFIISIMALFSNNLLFKNNSTKNSDKKIQALKQQSENFIFCATIMDIKPEPFALYRFLQIPY